MTFKMILLRIMTANIMTLSTKGNSGVDLIKPFWRKFTHTLCKLDHFINISIICCITMKVSSLQYRVSKFTPKKFYEIDPGLTILSNNRLYCSIQHNDTDTTLSIMILSILTPRIVLC